MTTLTATLPATVAAVLSINAPWHPCRPSSVSVSGGVATLTNSAGEVLTDLSGQPLWT